MPRRLVRRDALKTGLAFAAGVTLWKRETGAASPNEKLNIACIGVGAQGAVNVKGFAGQNLVAFADVDDERAAASYKMYPEVKKYRDYRKLLDDLHGKLDAVAISTPDHMHFHPAHAAMQYGLNVYLEKPLAHNIWEIRTLTELARKKKLATQLGAQRHALHNIHRVVEAIQSGMIGDVQEVHSWVSSTRGMPKPLDDAKPAPATLDWDLWVGAAKFRPYHQDLCPYKWRFWWDYGTGEMGNWGCHILDIPFWALDLKYPTRIEADGPPLDPQRTPTSMHSRLEFPARGKLPSVSLHWYQGPPGDVLAQLKLADVKLKGANNLFVGSRGRLLCGFENMAVFGQGNLDPPKPFIPDSPGFHAEFVKACQGGPPATCHFGYGGPLAEAVILANVAYRAGIPFMWDGAQLKASEAKAESLLRQEYRQGWEIKA